MSWDSLYHYGYEDENIFQGLLRQIKDQVRIILIVGPLDSHLGLLEAIYDLGKLSCCKVFKSFSTSLQLIKNVMFSESGEDDSRQYFTIGVSAKTEYDSSGNKKSVHTLKPARFWVKKDEPNMCHPRFYRPL